MSRGDESAAPIANFAQERRYQGMTIRERFALAMAQGLLGGISADPAAIISGEQISGTAVALADDLLAALGHKSRYESERGDLLAALSGVAAVKVDQNESAADLLRRLAAVRDIARYAIAGLQP